MITFQHVCFSYHEDNPILVDLNLTFSQPGVHALMGASGIGKTTVLKLIQGLVKPQSGQIEGIGDQFVLTVFQKDRLLPWLSALDNIALSMPTPDQQLARNLLSALGVDDATMKPMELSGGMARRVAIARALALSPDILLMDEPFTGLDEGTKRLVASVCLARQKSIILTTHDIKEARLMQAQVVQMPESIGSCPSQDRGNTL